LAAKKLDGSFFMQTQRRLVLAAALGLIFSGCASAQPPSDSGNVSTDASRHEVHTSSRSPQSSDGTLLYVSNNNQSSIGIYSYPKLKQVGSLIAGRGVTGLCTDVAGNVWVVTPNDTLTEYAHDGSQPVATLSIPGDAPYGCTVDAAGSLAVVHDADNVSIYTNEQGTPQTYKDGGIGQIYSLTYDPQGDLFIYGTKSTGELQHPIVGELVSGGASFSNLTFNQKLPDMTFAQWDGNDLLLAGITKRTESTWTETVYTVAVSQSNLQVTGQNTFEAPKKHGIGRSALVQGSALLQEDNGGNIIWQFSYPAGKNPVRMIKTGRGGHRTGLAISV
jgi:hypothetical protein